MATETETGLSDHVRGVTVTTLTCLMGVIAGVASGIIVGTDAAAAQSMRSLAVLAAFVVLQFPVMKALGVDIMDFGAKDYLYIVFMTFALWFVSYAILLSSGTSF